MGGNSTSRAPQSGSIRPKSKVSAAPAKPTAAATKAANVDARKKVDPGKDLATPKEKYPAEVKKIKGKWGEYARAAVDIAKENGMSLNDPMVRFAMVLCAFMGKYARYIDLVPGHFKKSLNEDKLGKEELSKLQKAKLREQKEVPKDLREFSDLYKAENDKRAKDKKPALNATETSTLYVSYLLFGSPPKSDSTEPKVGYLTDHKVLAARLSHEYTDQKRAYGDEGLRALKKRKTIPKGTVIFFAPNFKTGIIAAYATGDRQGFVYYVPGSKDKKSFQLNSSTSPVKNELSLLAAFVPTHLQGAVAPTPTQTAETKPAASPAVAPAKAPSTTPSTLASSVTATVMNVEKQLRVAMKQTNVALKYQKAANVLSTSIVKIEDAIKKGTPQLFALYPKLKEKYDIALKKYYALISAVIKIKEKELEDNIKKLKRLRPKLKAERAKPKKDEKAIAKLRLELLLPDMHEKAFGLVNPYLDKMNEYLKRAKECLPKSASK